MPSGILYVIISVVGLGVLTEDLVGGFNMLSALSVASRDITPNFVSIELRVSLDMPGV
jgi:hypothetical protein